MRDLLTSLAELTGITLVAVGCATFSIGAGLIAGGIGLIAVGYMASAGPMAGHDGDTE